MWENFTPSTPDDKIVDLINNAELADWDSATEKGPGLYDQDISEGDLNNELMPFDAETAAPGLITGAERALAEELFERAKEARELREFELNADYIWWLNDGTVDGKY